MRDTDYDKPPIGRQPFRPVITPSKPYPWYGTIRGGRGNERTPDLHADTATVGGERFTCQQVASMSDRRLDPASVEVLQVKRQATDREVWYGTGHLPPVFAFDCPVIRRRKVDGAILVIAPNGDATHVRPDGWTKAPRTRGRAGW